jgi:hypothetical protein
VLAEYIDGTIDAGLVPQQKPFPAVGRVMVLQDDGRPLVRPGETLGRAQR